MDRPPSHPQNGDRRIRFGARLLRARLLIAAGLLVSCVAGCSREQRLADSTVTALSPPHLQPAPTTEPVSSKAEEQPQPPDPSELFFSAEQVSRIHIEIAPPEMQKLRENHRSYVRCQMQELTGDKNVSYTGVGVKLKGAAGSFRELDDRPALTINMNKFRKGQAFHTLDKFHLNNSVQDESYCCEWLSSDLFRSAGVPTPRVSFARVWLNERDLGLYVLKEGFDRRFVGRHFPDKEGNLYDSGFVQDIDGDLEKDSGHGPDDRSDLHALRAACEEPDPAKRHERLEQLLDIEEFLKFVALEQMTCHWDGYARGRNNYRIYFDPKTGKASFFPHGMDQMFGDPHFNVHEIPEAILSHAVLEDPVWHARYWELLKELLPRFSPADTLVSKVDRLQARLQPVLKEINADAVEPHREQVHDLKGRLEARAAELTEQILHNKPPPAPVALEFNEQHEAALADWEATGETDAHHEQVDLGEGHPAYLVEVVKAGEPCVASWRKSELLEPGQYTLLARAKCENLEPTQEGPGAGAGIRISGSHRTNHVSGTSDWTDLEFEFTLEEPQQIVFVAELRATSGRVWYDVGSLRLRRKETD